MNCGLRKAEAKLVDLGREMGPPYFYCKACKLEQKEWEARVSPVLEALTSKHLEPGASIPMSYSYKIEDLVCRIPNCGCQWRSVTP